MIAQGLDPHEVDGRLRKGAAGIVKAGYNLRGKYPHLHQQPRRFFLQKSMLTFIFFAPVLFQGPEQPVTNIGDRLQGTEWGATGQGMGIRGYANATATLRFEGESFVLPACLSSCRLIDLSATNQPNQSTSLSPHSGYRTVLYCAKYADHAPT